MTEALRITDVRRQIEAYVTGASPTMKNISKPALMSLKFPLPLKNEQTALTDALAEAGAKAATLREQPNEARANAWAKFEAAIYATDETAEAAMVVIDAS